MLAPLPLETHPPDVGPARKRNVWQRDIIEVLMIALVLYLIIWSVLQTVRVDGSSMEKTLQNSDLLLASKISYKIGDPERGDIVIFVPPVGPDRDFIKRVIAVPGDVIEIGGVCGARPSKLLIKPGGNGDYQTVQEPYLNEPWLQLPPPAGSWCAANGYSKVVGPTPVTVPAGEYFVMGDNRNHSEDSRIFGFITRGALVSKAILRIWPPFKFGLGPGATLIPSIAAAGPLWALMRKPKRQAKRRARRARQR